MPSWFLSLIHIFIAFNLEDGDYAYIEDSKALYDLVKVRLLPDKMNYIFLDEVQRVTDFQKAVDSLIPENRR